jgi:hypothetical protein
MTPKEAYCCLNCADLPPCNAAAGNCVECCEDCGDTSECLSSAYFDGSSFFKDYIYTANASSSYLYYGLFGDANLGGYENYTSTYDTSKEIPCEKNGSRLEQRDSVYFLNNYYSYNGATTTSISNYEDCDYCPITTTGPSSCVNGDPIIETQCSSPEACFDCVFDISCSLACVPFSTCIEGTIYRAFETYKTEITFKNPVNLYNSLGENVGNIISADYNSNNPARSWSAPGCHFFAP